MTNKMRIKVTKDDVKKATKSTGDFVTPKPGWYVLRLSDANPGYSKGPDGTEDRNKPRLEMVYEIAGIGPENYPTTENYGNVWDYLTFGENTGWKRASILMAFGEMEYTEDPDDAGEFEGEVDWDDHVGNLILANLRLDTKNKRSPDDPPRIRIGQMKPFSGAVAAGSAFSEAADEVPDEVWRPTETDDGEELYTEVELIALDLKSLGAVAGEFDIDPTNHLVKKGKKVDADETKAALVAAILEAQGGNEDDDGEDENPF